MMLILGILVGLISLTILVALHELGHALAAKKNGVKLEEFGIGFPPAVFKFKTKTDKILPKGTPVSINWIPLGGFVKLQGEHDSDSKKGDYGSASFWGKTQILLAGVAMNWLISIVIFSILAIFGLPKMIPNQFILPFDSKTVGGEVIVAQVIDGLPAQKAGIKVDDEILQINNTKIETAAQISEISKNNAGKKVEVLLKRGNEELSKTVELRTNNDDGKGIIGLASSEKTAKIYSTWSAPIVGFGTTVQLSAETFKGVGELFSNLFNGVVHKISSGTENQKVANEQLSKAGESVTGPIAIVGQVFPQATQAGFDKILLLMAIISLSLACMNVLPIPALDGGRWLLTFVFRILLKKPLSAETEENINGWSFLALMILSVLIIVLDFTKIF